LEVEAARSDGLVRVVDVATERVEVAIANLRVVAVADDVDDTNRRDVVEVHEAAADLRLVLQKVKVKDRSPAVGLLAGEPGEQARVLGRKGTNLVDLAARGVE